MSGTVFLVAITLEFQVLKTAIHYRQAVSCTLATAFPFYIAGQSERSKTYQLNKLNKSRTNLLQINQIKKDGLIMLLN